MSIPTAFTASLKRRKVENTRLVDGVEGVLDEFAESTRLGIITNGEGDIQREKLATHGIDGYFEHVLISGERETMKPKDEMFEMTKREWVADGYVYVADRSPTTSSREGKRVRHRLGVRRVVADSGPRGAVARRPVRGRRHGRGVPVTERSVRTRGFERLKGNRMRTTMDGTVGSRPTARIADERGGTDTDE
ncbi:hypothetical protein A4G99_18115 [Haladaptatus sp. R4]|uniref:HAD hydrolase-like protein n=1 Tax=Haladaptatus sp. R4 TaxID=1679489 RepID=UPI0007B49D0A|nr:HAD hydrolase-like protein [Haladaptatus sp. R4]KZN22692.1 hypothetical protein A4G99_18115 [Haladaptatus sp. R4]